MTQLEQLIRDASDNAGKIFNQKGSLIAMFHLVCADGRVLILTSPMQDKDKVAAIARAICAKEDVRRCVFITEAWITELTNERRGERSEVVLFAGEDVEEGMLIGMRPIARKGGSVRVVPLTINDRYNQLAGRFVGLLSSSEGKLQ